jgi:hypothetical protein
MLMPVTAADWSEFDWTSIVVNVQRIYERH